jgi:hypothetical protein
MLPGPSEFASGNGVNLSTSEPEKLSFSGCQVTDCAAFGTALIELDAAESPVELTAFRVIG